MTLKDDERLCVEAEQVIEIGLDGAESDSPNYIRSQEYFYSGGLRPGHAEEIQGYSWPMTIRCGFECSDQEPAHTAHGSVVFVEFEDGSYWGDPAKGQETLKERPVGVKILKHLLAVYRNKPLDEFINELLAAPTLNVIEQVKETYRKTRDPAVTADLISHVLQAADKHRDAMALVPGLNLSSAFHGR